jgi:hypothetical protein
MPSPAFLPALACSGLLWPCRTYGRHGCCTWRDGDVTRCVGKLGSLQSFAPSSPAAECRAFHLKTSALVNSSGPGAGKLPANGGSGHLYLDRQRVTATLTGAANTRHWTWMQGASCQPGSSSPSSLVPLAPSVGGAPSAVDVCTHVRSSWYCTYIHTYMPWPPSVPCTHRG